MVHKEHIKLATTVDIRFHDDLFIFDDFGIDIELIAALSLSDIIPVLY